MGEYCSVTQTSDAPVVDERLANMPEGGRPQDKKKIIKSGRMGIRTKEPGKEKARIDLLVGKYGGYYARDKFNDTDWESTFDLSISIPVSAYEKFIVEVARGEGSVLYREIDARDVTEQFVGLEARLGDKRSYISGYRDFV